MINTINEVVSLLNTASSKKDFESTINKLDNDISSFLIEIKYNPANVRTVDLKLETVEEMSKKLKSFTEKPILGILEGVQRYQDIVRKFLEIYHIGFIKEFYLTRSGYFKCSIPTLISKPTFTTTPCSDKLNFEQQLELLEKEGLTLIQGKRKEIKIPAIQTNIDTIKKLLGKLKAKHIALKLREEDDILCISEIDFCVQPEILNSFNENREKIIIPVSEELNVDEIERIYKLLKDIANTKANSSLTGLSDTCGKLICSYFSEICEVLNIETKISKKVKEEYRKAREESQKRNDLKSQIAKQVTPKILKESAEKIYDYIDKLFTQTINFNCDEIQIGPYGINVKANVLSGYWLDDDILMSDEDFHCKFDCLEEANRRDYSLVMLPTEKNMDFIKNFIFEKFPDSNFEGFSIQSKNIEYTHIRYQYLSKFEFSFSDLSFF